MMIVVRCVTVTLEDNINLPQPPHLVTANSRGLAEAGQEGGPWSPGLCTNRRTTGNTWTVCKLTCLPPMSLYTLSGL